ncbi:MAG: hypothetical protein GY853_09850 [PVC group bacterium]|nr:hypothetical protein [PVC group bacterium]
MKKPSKPSKLKEEHLYYLDDLRESGVTNMYGATPFLQEDFEDLNIKESRDILLYWMKTFSDRHNIGEKK